MKKFKTISVAKRVVEYCINNNKKYVFISGNGGSGKSQFALEIKKEASKKGNANLICMDDFIVDTKLRNNARISWKDSAGVKHTGRYTTSIPQSYFLQNVNAIINNLEHGNNYYHWPKKAQKPKESILFYGDSNLNIIEGVGSAFLEKNKLDSVSIFLECDDELEISRRIKRKQKSNEQSPEEVNREFNERRAQFRANVEWYKKEHDLILDSKKDYSVDVLLDRLGVLK